MMAPEELSALVGLLLDHTERVLHRRAIAVLDAATPDVAWLLPRKDIVAGAARRGRPRDAATSPWARRGRRPRVCPKGPFHASAATAATVPRADFTSR